MLAAVTAQADEPGPVWLVRTWQTDDGLPENWIFSVVQSPDGFFWVATRGGLVRFDGLRFQTLQIDHAAGFPRRDIRAQHFDRRGWLWLGYQHGEVVCLQSDRVEVYSAKDGLPDQPIASFAEDASGTMIASYDSTHGLLQVQVGQRPSILNSADLPTTNHYEIASGQSGEVWVAMDQRVGVLRNGRFQEITRVEEPVLKICVARAGGIWIATARQLLRFEGGRPPEAKAMLSGDRSLTALLEDHTGAIWIGTLNSGLWRWRGGPPEPVATQDRQIRCLAEDNEHNIWVGTSAGLNQLRPRSIELLAANDGMSLNSLQSVAEQVAEGDAARDQLWAVTEDGQVVRQEGSSWAGVSSQADWPGGSATGIAGGSPGVIWIGASGPRLHRFEHGKFRSWGRSDGLAGGNIRSLFISSSGDVWLASIGFDGIQRLRDGRFQTFPLPEVRSSSKVRTIVEDLAGTIWMSTAGGELLRVQEDRLVRVFKSDQALLPSIRSLLPAPDGSLWIGYGGSGLARWQAGKFTLITTADGLNDDYISQMLLDDDGRLWLAGARGLSYVRLAELTAVAEGRTERVRSVVYGRNVALKSLQAVANDGIRALRRHRGELCFPMRSGLLVVHPTIFQFQASLRPPPVLLESVLVDGQPVAVYDSRSLLRVFSPTNLLDLRPAGASVHLRPDYRKLEIGFCAPSFASALNVQYRYQLEGFDEGWVETVASRSVSYPALPAGNYRFRVTARNEEGVWNENAATLKLTVTPFFWQTGWFRLGLLGLLTLSSGGAVYYLTRRRLKRHMRQLERQSELDRERERIARDMHDTLGASLTQINILGALASRPAASLEQIRENVATIAGSSQNLLLQLDEIVWAVDPENDTLDGLGTYISQFATEFFAGQPIRCRMRTPAQLPTLKLTSEVRHNIFLAVKEALNNAARHSGATEVIINLTTAGKTLVISVEDDGHGFDPAIASTRHGLVNLRQRMAAINGTCRIASRAGAGTTITLEWRWQDQ